MWTKQLIPTHRGAPENLANRFEKIHLEPDADRNPEDDPLPRTQFLVDHSQTAIAYNHSPDLGFGRSRKTAALFSTPWRKRCFSIPTGASKPAPIKINSSSDSKILPKLAKPNFVSRTK